MTDTNTNTLVKKENQEGIINKVDFTKEQIETVRNTIMPKGTNNSELQLFLEYCRRTQLDPFSRQIYATKIGDKLSMQSTIDGFRVVAERSNKYRGQTLPQFLKKDGTWTDVWTDTGYPIAAKVGILRSDFAEPLYAIAKWSSYAPMVNGKIGFMWAKMPDLMLAKTAEALALRKAFPNDLSGIYSSEEMEQAGAGPRQVESTSQNAEPEKVIQIEVTPTFMTEQEFQTNIDALKQVDKIERLEFQYGKIDSLKRLSPEQKETLKKAHVNRILEIEPAYLDPNNIIVPFPPTDAPQEVEVGEDGKVKVIEM